MSRVDWQLTMLLDARRRDMARMFVALFVAMSMVFSLAAGVTGPAQVVMAAEAPAGEAGLDDAVQEESVDEPAAGADEGEPEGGFDEGEDPSEPSDGEAGNDEGEDPSEPSDGEAGNDEGTDEEPSFLLMGGHGGGGGNGTVVIHKFGKGVAGNEFPLNGARFLLERWERGCFFFFFCGYSWKEYKTVTDNGQDDHDKDAPGVIELRLPAGTYRITEDRAPNGYDWDTKTKVKLTVQAGKSYGPYKFVNRLKITKPAIIIKKYADENNNGKIDKHDTLLGGVTFLVERLVRSGNNNEWVVNESFHVTDNGPDDDDPTPGVILLNEVSLEDGSNQYRVTEIAPEGWVALTPPITKEITKKKSSSQVVFEFLNQRVPEPEPEPNLSVVKTLIDPESGIATVGDSVVFKITVENTGEVALEDIQVTDAFDADYLEFVGIDEVNDEQVNGNEISWQIESLAVEESVTYTVRFIAKAATGAEGTINHVQVPIGDLVRQADDEVVIVDEPTEDDTPRTPGRVPRTPRVDLAVTKVVDDPTPEEGQFVTFTITVRNEGPDDAEDVVYSDLIPAGLTYVSHEASQGSYDPVSGEWALGDLADGASATLTVTVIVDAGTAGQLLTNTVTLVASSPDDTNSSNNSASASVAPPQIVLVEEEPPAAGPGEDEAPPLPVTGGSMALLLIPGITLLGAGLYVRRRYLR